MFVSCWRLVDCESEMRTLSLLQVTVVAGPPVETQVRVREEKLYSIGESTRGVPETSYLQYVIIYMESYLHFFCKLQQKGSRSHH